MRANLSALKIGKITGFQQKLSLIFFEASERALLEATPQSLHPTQKENP
jgi:hypothetical protein